jgi:hypothetical protein
VYNVGMPSQIIERQAKLLANENRLAEPSITTIYWFPNDHEVRLVEVLSTVPANGDRQLQPFFFRPSPVDNLPAPSGVAFVRPDEVNRARLPDTWGDWADAVELETEE